MFICKLVNQRRQRLPIHRFYNHTGTLSLEKNTAVLPWLEYFKDADACFCYPCQMFAKDSTKEKALIESGFSNWKTAMESGKGFKKHEQSEVHMRAMASWK